MGYFFEIVTTHVDKNRKGKLSLSHQYGNQAVSFSLIL